MDKRMIGAVALCALVLTGCTASPGGTSTPKPTYTAAAPTTSPDAATAAAEDAQAVALATMNAFVNHSRGQDEWWADFSQYLSPEALYVWEGTQADRVTASTITGDPVVSVVDGTFVSVIVPTNVGTYKLDMAMRVDESTAGTWLVFEMTAPETSE
jgi:hypothetical protein